MSKPIISREELITFWIRLENRQRTTEASRVIEMIAKIIDTYWRGATCRCEIELLAEELSDRFELRGAAEAVAEVCGVIGLSVRLMRKCNGLLEWTGGEWSRTEEDFIDTHRRHAPLSGGYFMMVEWFGRTELPRSVRTPCPDLGAEKNGSLAP